MKYIKQAHKPSVQNDPNIKKTVARILEDIANGGEDAAARYALDLDGWARPIPLTGAQRRDLAAEVPAQMRRDIEFAYHQVRRFGEAQLASVNGFEMETEPGALLGQIIRPVSCAGCYVPGGRYAHIASALMSITPACIAGVEHIVACTPPIDGKLHPAVVYAMDLAGADDILQIGGVQAISAMAEGLFTGVPADIVVGPGNAYVAEAKRQLFGRIGIDVIAGPTESAIIADDNADVATICVDLISQAEHGITSPVWLITTSQDVANETLRQMPAFIRQMPNREVVDAAWQDYGEIVCCEDREEAATVSDNYAPEHLQILAADTDWWLQRLRNYGSLFLGEGCTVAHGDKCSGTNHILPTGQASRYSGGLNVQKFLKILTYQKLTGDAVREFSAVASRMSRKEGMEGHARACDLRLRKHFPDEDWDFEVYGAI